MVCEKNHNHSQKGTDLVDLNICEGCKYATSYPGQKSLLSARRGSKVELLRNILDNAGNVLEVINSLPLMVTLYDMDGLAVTRNREAAFYFSSLPQSPNFKNSTFIPCMNDRNEANSLLAKLIAGILHLLFPSPFFPLLSFHKTLLLALAYLKLKLLLQKFVFEFRTLKMRCM
jgi:hypothetical protein